MMVRHGETAMAFWCRIPPKGVEYTVEDLPGWMRARYPTVEDLQRIAIPENVFVLYKDLGWGEGPMRIFTKERFKELMDAR